MHVVLGLITLVYILYLVYLASQVTICWLLAGRLQLANLPPALEVVQFLTATVNVTAALVST